MLRNDRYSNWNSLCWENSPQVVTCQSTPEREGKILWRLAPRSHVNSLFYCSLSRHGWIGDIYLGIPKFLSSQRCVLWIFNEIWCETNLAFFLSQSKMIICFVQMAQEISIHRELDYKHVVKFKSYFEDTHYVYIILELCKKRVSIDFQFSASLLILFISFFVMIFWMVFTIDWVRAPFIYFCKF